MKEEWKSRTGSASTFQTGQFKDPKMDSVSTIHACDPLEKSLWIPMGTHAGSEDCCHT